MTIVKYGKHLFAIPNTAKLEAKMIIIRNNTALLENISKIEKELKRLKDKGEECKTSEEKDYD